MELPGLLLTPEECFKDPLRQHQLGHPSPSISAALLRRGGKRHFSTSPLCHKLQPTLSPTPAHGASPSIHPFPRGHRVMETQQLPVLPMALGWEVTSLPRASSSAALAASTPPGSLRSLCSISFPAWSCCQTSHCDTVPEAELAPLVSQTVPNPCGWQREPNPRDWPGAVVHLMSIYDGLCNVFPRFDLTRYKLKPFLCGRREEQFLLC